VKARDLASGGCPGRQRLAGRGVCGVRDHTLLFPDASERDLQVTHFLRDGEPPRVFRRHFKRDRAVLGAAGAIRRVPLVTRTLLRVSGRHDALRVAVKGENPDVLKNRLGGELIQARRKRVSGSRAALHVPHRFGGLFLKRKNHVHPVPSAHEP